VNPASLTHVKPATNIDRCRARPGEPPRGLTDHRLENARQIAGDIVMTTRLDELNMSALERVAGAGFGDMREMDTLAVQMALDRKSQFVEACSNMMKSIAGTDSQILQNLK
jgi:hypothetical protein